MRPKFFKDGFICVELLDSKAFFFCLFPYFIREKSCGSSGPGQLLFIDATKAGYFFANTCLKLFGIQCEKLDFRRIDVRDADGDSAWLQVTFKDVNEIQRKICMEHPLLTKLQDNDSGLRLKDFLMKKSLHFNVRENDSLLKLLFIVRLFDWKANNSILSATGETQKEKVLFIKDRPWFEIIRSYAASYQIECIGYKTHVGILEGFLSNKMLRKTFKTFLYWIKMSLYYIARPAILLDRNKSSKKEKSSRTNGQPTIGVEYYGCLNLDKPEMFSDLFFWRNSTLKNEHMLLLTEMVRAPLNDEDMSEIYKYGLDAVALTTQAVQTPFVKTHSYMPKGKNLPENLKSQISCFEMGNRKEDELVSQQIEEYCEEYEYWRELFRKWSIKMYVTWYHTSARHFAIMDAINDLGGVGVIYQRSFQSLPTPANQTSADVLFGFSRYGYELYQQINSRISYYVITGFLGDFRMELLQNQSAGIRRELQKNGADKIIAYFDENSFADQRWRYGNESMREDYAFLLNKVLENPRIGLICKPKVLFSFRSRLGHINDLLKQAEATGRCRVIEEGKNHSEYPPALAVLAADVAIHGRLSAATSGYEAALCGVPTLLLDRVGFSMSPLYQLGEGRVVFRKWEDLWDACMEHFNRQDGLPGFGDWSAQIDKFDPFRDGRAVERMGEYMRWIFEGIKEGCGRQKALALAAERYCDKWGQDKVISMSSDLCTART